MVNKTIKLNNESGMHARPASELAKTAMKYACDIKLNINGKEYNAKSVLNIMSAGIKQNTEIEVICNGKNEEQALNEIINLFTNNFE